MSAAELPLKLGSNVYSTLRKYLRTYPRWRFAPPRVQLNLPMERFGSDYGGYFLDPFLVRSDSVVYSLGIGEDISFDLSLIERFGVSVEAFDPTPKVKTWLLSQTIPPQFHFHAVGVAGRDGHETFYLPPKEDWVSHSVVPARQFRRDSVRLPVMRLSTAMRLQGHDRIDLLKMDIEGAEYAVIEEILSEKIQIKQLLIEFHHRLTSLGTQKTKQALALLEKCGLRISFVCPRKEIFTLVQAD
jgi:FkbM family methyltransferase